MGKMIKFRCTDDQEIAYKDKAERGGLSLGGLIKLLLDSYDPAVPNIKPPRIESAIKTPVEAKEAVGKLPKAIPPYVDVPAKKSGKQRDRGAPANLSDERIAELKEFAKIKPSDIEGEDYRWSGNRIVKLGFGQR